MGHTGNMIIKDFIRQMCVPLENNVYFGDGDGFNSNPEQMLTLHLISVHYAKPPQAMCITMTS